MPNPLIFVPFLTNLYDMLVDICINLSSLKLDMHGLTKVTPDWF